MKIDFESYSVESKIPKIKGKTINRELSWLKFNERVLYCANDKNIPLNERLKFLAITTSNLDEFISVRYSYALTEDKEPKDEILKGILSFMKLQNETYEVLKNELKKNDVEICRMNELSKKEVSLAKHVFTTQVFPILTPINIGVTNDIPNLSNGQICIAVIIGDSVENLLLIPISNNISQLFKIKNGKYVTVEDLVLYFLKDLFINKNIKSTGIVRVIKDGNIILNHDQSQFILDRMVETLEKRDMSNPIFLEISKSCDKRLKRILTSAFNVNEKNSYSGSDILGYKRFMKPLLSDKYSYTSFEPSIYEVVEQTHSLFTTIKEKDILLQHPYDSYETVVKFINHAAVDNDVVAIKQTLYRVSSQDSPIVNALCTAAKRGKEVSVLIEIKARFDETQNIALIHKLERSGVNVLLGMEYLKTHCKMCIVVRREKNDMRIYSHIGTGNYNEKTAMQYTDISYFTSKQKIGVDLLNIFNILSGVSTPDDKLQKVFYAPVNLRSKIIKNINREIAFAKKEKQAEIFFKLNSINDPIIINKIYEAADKGVKVYIIARGICTLTPRKNIYIKSIVGRFLEHSRIYYFRNGGDSEYYISSADFLTRNLDNRVETLLLINDDESISKLKNIISVFKSDEYNSFIMDEKGKYKKSSGKFDCHQWFIDNAVANGNIRIPRHKKKK